MRDPSAFASDSTRRRDIHRYIVIFLHGRQTVRRPRKSNKTTEPALGLIAWRPSSNKRMIAENCSPIRACIFHFGMNLRWNGSEWNALFCKLRNEDRQSAKKPRSCRSIQWPGIKSEKERERKKVDSNWCTLILKRTVDF